MLIIIKFNNWIFNEYSLFDNEFYFGGLKIILIIFKLFNMLNERSIKMEKNVSLEQIDNMIQELVDPSEVYSVGVHFGGITTGESYSSKDDFSKSILENGLLSKQICHFGVAATVALHGFYDNADKLINLANDSLIRVENNLTNGAVIVAIPGTLKGIDGQDYFLGTFPDVKGRWLRADDRRLYNIPINNIVKKLEYIPKEFILGVIQKINGEIRFIPNYNFISCYSEDKQIAFFENLKQLGEEINPVKDVAKEGLYKGTFDESFMGENATISHDYVIESAREYLKERARKNVERHI